MRHLRELVEWFKGNGWGCMAKVMRKGIVAEALFCYLLFFVEEDTHFAKQ